MSNILEVNTKIFMIFNSMDKLYNIRSYDGTSLQQGLERGHQIHVAAGAGTESSLDFHIERVHSYLLLR